MPGTSEVELSLPHGGLGAECGLTAAASRGHVSGKAARNQLLVRSRVGAADAVLRVCVCVYRGGGGVFSRDTEPKVKGLVLAKKHHERGGLKQRELIVRQFWSPGWFP